MLDAKTMSQLDVTISLIGDVATSGVVCITFGLYMLHIARKTSTYVSGLSATAVVMSVITWVRTRQHLGSKVEESGTENGADLLMCGGIDPAKYCEMSGNPGTYSDFESFNDKKATATLEAPILAFCVLIMLFSLLCQGGALSKIRARAVLPQRNTRAQAPTLFSKTRKALATSSTWVWVTLRHGLVESLFVSMAAIMLLWLVSPSTFNVYTDDEPIWAQSPQWSFGQLMAVMIWAPTIIEYLYSAICGIEEAHEHRYTSPYKVIKNESGSDEAGKMCSLPRKTTSYRRLVSHSRSHSDLDLSLVHVHDDSSGRSSMQIV